MVREGRKERFLEAPPTFSSSAVHWRGIALENWSVPAVLIPRHEHPEHFLHVVLSGTVKYQVSTKGRLVGFTHAREQFSGSPMGWWFAVPRFPRALAIVLRGPLFFR